MILDLNATINDAYARYYIYIFSYYQQITMQWPDGLQLTQVFDAPTLRRIENGGNFLTSG